MGRKTLDEMKQLAQANNHSSLTWQLIVAIAWKESSFDPDAVASGSSGTGLMMMTTGAVQDVNNNTPQGVHFDHSEMKDPAKNLSCATYYLGILLQRFGSKKSALEHYGTGAGYADNLLAAEGCLQSLVVVEPMSCLQQIHP
jgi:membrane-bound lytic murein transglycosylase MltF